jgi:hypothetical protein
LVESQQRALLFEAVAAQDIQRMPVAHVYLGHYGLGWRGS